MSMSRPTSSPKKSGRKAKANPCEPKQKPCKPLPCEGELHAAIEAAKAQEVSSAPSSPLFAAMGNADVVMASLLFGKLVQVQKTYESTWSVKPLVPAPSSMLPPMF